jgi:HlyD family secretion protein
VAGTEQEARAAGDEDEEEEKVVFVVVDGKAERRAVETGIADETHVEVTRGLEGGESVVTGPYRTLRDLEDGDAVRVEEPDEDGEDEDGEDEGPSAEVE